MKIYTVWEEGPDGIKLRGSHEEKKEAHKEAQWLQDYWDGFSPKNKVPKRNFEVVGASLIAMPFKRPEKPADAFK